PLTQPQPAYEFNQRITWWPETAPRLRTTPGWLVPTPARLFARGRLGVSAGCRRKSTLDPPR
ncbi:MAG TPA: hypothetical protein VF014_12030, partial [Casimicrobiaceae bacterium]|nr:hypothetical protein [Casimicrobiaceae bacterium]